MATALLISDDLHINHINPYTWTGAYGVNTDGFPKNIAVSGTEYTTQVDETPMEESGRPDLDEDLNFNFSGPMYVKTVEARGPAPFRPYPARKFEYSDGTVSWYRPDLKWPWMGKGRTQASYDQETITDFIKDNSFLIFLIILVAFLFFLSKKK